MSASLLISQELKPGCESEFRLWEGRINAAAGRFPGFQGLELTAPVPGLQGEWVAALHFDSLPHLQDWLSSDIRGQLLREAEDLWAAPPTELVVHSSADPIVSAVVVTQVEADRVEAFRAWQRAMQQAQGQFGGYLGSELFAPAQESSTEWTALIRFESSAQLDAWLQSEERQRLLDTAHPDFRRYRLKRVGGAFAGWFPVRGQRPVPNWKQFLSVLLVLYPVIMLLDRAVGAWLEPLSPATRIFLSNILSLIILTWGMLPLVNRLLGFWLVPAADAPRRQELAVTMAIGLALLTMLWAFQ